MGEVLKMGLLNIDWSKIKDFSEEEITYFLFLEGKNIEAISTIRNIDRSIVQNHIIQGKIKYRLLTKSSSTKELFAQINSAGKDDKLQLLSFLPEEGKKELVSFIKKSYYDFSLKEKEAAVWIIGELKDSGCVDILRRAAVHKSINIRRMAVSALGKLSDSASEDILIRALEDENPQVVQYAIKALSKIKASSAQYRIEEIYRNSEKEYLRKAAEDFMKSLSVTIFEVE